MRYSKLKGSVDITSSGMNGLIIRTNASPYGTGPCVREGKCPLLVNRSRCKCSMETSRNYVIMSKTVLRSNSLTWSRFSEMSDQWKVSLYMIISQNVM